MRYLVRALAILMFFQCMTVAANAGCSTTSGTVDLGTQPSTTVAVSAQGASGSTGFTCTSSILSLASTNTVTATIVSVSNSLGTQPRLGTSPAGDYIPYSICKDSSCSSTYAVGTPMVWSSTTLLGLLGLFNASGGTLPIYAKTTAGTQVAAGTYTSVIAINWSWSLCSVGVLGACVYETGSTTNTVTVTLIVTNDCTIVAPALNFGSAAFVGSLKPVTQNITIRCSKGAAYTVGIDNGLNFSTNRRLANGTNYIGYEIYFPSTGTTRWGSVGGQRVSSAAATTNATIYTGTTDQTYTYKAVILPGQPVKPKALYSDTLLVNVVF
jgi:spore coat protein U-like protein